MKPIKNLFLIFILIFGSVFIPMGKNIFTGKKVLFNERGSFGVNVIAAVTRYGKSSLVKLLYVMISKHRPVLVFDYRGEHIDSMYSNFKSRDYIAGVNNLTILEDFGFMISDFTSVSDWRSLGFASKGALMMSELSRRVDIHKNDPDIFYRLLLDLPDTNEEITAFNDKYKHLNLSYENRINSSSKDSIVNSFRFTMKSGIFIYPDELEDGTKNYIEDFGRYMYEHRNVIVNLKMNELDEFIAKAYAGKLLEQLAPWLTLIKPCIILEEADILVPNVVDRDDQPSSLTQAIKYVIKLQKYNPELFFICQDLGRLNSTVVGNAHTLILGQMPDDTYSKYREHTQDLRWEHDDNYREFAVVTKGRKWVEKMVPLDCPCKS